MTPGLPRHASGVFSLLLTLLLASPGAAQTADSVTAATTPDASTRARLVSLAKLPSLNIEVAVGDKTGEDKAPPEARLADAEARLAKNSKDYQAAEDRIDAFKDLGRTNVVETARTDLVKMLREHLAANGADGDAWAKLAGQLQAMSDIDGWSDAVRQGLNAVPNHGGLNRMRSYIHIIGALSLLSGGSNANVKFKYADLPAFVARYKDSPHLLQARHLVREAESYSAKAMRLSPDDFDNKLTDITAGTIGTALDCAMSEKAGRPCVETDAMQAWIRTNTANFISLLADHAGRSTNRFSSPRTVALSLMILERRESYAKLSGPLPGLPPDIRDKFTAVEDEIPTLDRARASKAMETLYMAHMGRGATNDALKWASRLASEIPENASGWMMLARSKFEERTPEATNTIVEMARKRMEHAPSASAHHFLIKALAYAGRHDEALREGESLLKSDPADIFGNLAMGALLLTRAKSDTEADRAARYRDEAVRMLKARDLKDDRALRDSADIQAAIWNAWFGRFEQARKNVQAILSRDLEDETAWAVLRIINASGPPAGKK